MVVPAISEPRGRVPGPLRLRLPERVRRQRAQVPSRDGCLLSVEEPDPVETGPLILLHDPELVLPVPAARDDLPPGGYRGGLDGHEDRVARVDPHAVPVVPGHVAERPLDLIDRAREPSPVRPSRPDPGPRLEKLSPGLRFGKEVIGLAPAHPEGCLHAVHLADVPGHLPGIPPEDRGPPARPAEDAGARSNQLGDFLDGRPAARTSPVVHSPPAVRAAQASSFFTRKRERAMGTPIEGPVKRAWRSQEPVSK